MRTFGRVPGPAPALGALLLVACAGRSGKGPQAPVDLSEQAPVLPAALGEVYGHRAALPPDPVVAVSLGALAWDEALSGAAGALALEMPEGFTLQQAQWAAWRAGYPFEVHLGATGTSDGPAPPAQVAELLASRVPAGADLGLARARSGEQDRWVALVASPLSGVAPFARQYAQGEAFRLALPEGSRWTMVDPEGNASAGQGPVEANMAAWGEWWLEAELPGGRLSVPLYVGMDMPPTPVVDLPGSTAAGPDDAQSQAWAVLADLRDTFDVSGLQPDPVLQTLSRVPLEQAAAGTWDHDQNLQRLRAAGFAEGPVDQVHCRAATVAQCLEGLLRTAAGRQALMDPELHVAGIATTVGSDGVSLVISLAGG